MAPKRVCPESLRRVPVSTGAQFSLLQPNPKGLQNGSQNEAFEEPRSSLYSLFAYVTKIDLQKALTFLT